LNLRTRELDRAVEAAGALTPEQQLEFARLRDDQQRLLELVIELLPVEGHGPEDDPAGLPDVDPEEDVP